MRSKFCRKISVRAQVITPLVPPLGQLTSHRMVALLGALSQSLGTAGLSDNQEQENVQIPEALLVILKPVLN